MIQPQFLADNYLRFLDRDFSLEFFLITIFDQKLRFLQQDY